MAEDFVLSDQERRAFEATFSVVVAGLKQVVLPDKFILRPDHPLFQDHERIAAIQLALGRRCDAMPEPQIVALLQADPTVVGLDETSAVGRGRLAVAALERLLWLSVNSTEGGQFRPEFNWYARATRALARRLLDRDCDLPQDLLAVALSRIVIARQLYVLEVMPSVAAALELIAAHSPLSQELRAALGGLAEWMTREAKDSFSFSGGLNRTVGGQRIGKLVERMTRLASAQPQRVGNVGQPGGASAGPASPAPHGDGSTARPAWGSVGDIYPCEPAAAVPSVKVPTGSKRLALRSLSKHEGLAAALFGEAQVDELEVAELSVGELVVLETSPQPWSHASAFLTKHREAAAKHGFELALCARSLSEVRPQLAVVRAALSKVHDDAAYRSWLADGLLEHESEFTGSWSALDELVNGLASKKPRSAGLRPPEEAVRIVALNANAAVVPVLTATRIRRNSARWPRNWPARSPRLTVCERGSSVQATDPNQPPAHGTHAPSRPRCR